MADENGDYVSRFERVAESQEVQGRKIAGIVTMQQVRVARDNEAVAKIDALVGAIRDLIYRIPPENLRWERAEAFSEPRS